VATLVHSEDVAPYGDPDRYSVDVKEHNHIIEQALAILEGRLRVPGVALESPADTTAYLRLQLGELEHEEFHVLLLDNRHRVLAMKRIARGTIDGASVHPREVVKAGLRFNAAAVILAHNHPSGMAEPSQADISLTRRLTDALALVDVRVLDHIVVGGTEACSFAERGML
jgi:DNA repair protein RadC